MDDKALTYDANGNVLTYGDRTFTWERGRVLKEIEEGENTYSYSYDDEGIRTAKTVNGVTTSYITEGGVILSQSDGSNTMLFQYDSNSNLSGFTYNGTQYHYITNQMGDVCGITDAEGNLLATYRYDEWGNLLAIETAEEGNAQQLALAEANPFRYRSYYHDAESGYYYLQSRYYDTAICRFINADMPEFAGVTEHVVSCNLFAYCRNNSIIGSDATGLFPVHIIAGVAFGVAWAVIPRLIGDVIRGKMSKISDYVGDALAGAVSGLVTSLTGNSTIGSVFGTFVGETVRFLMAKAPKLRISNFKAIMRDFMFIVLKAVLAGVASWLAGKIIGHISKKFFPPRQIKNFFKNTKYLSSALGIGKGGKTARRMWFADAGITTLLSKLLGI